MAGIKHVVSLLATLIIAGCGGDNSTSAGGASPTPTPSPSPSPSPSPTPSPTPTPTPTPLTTAVSDRRLFQISNPTSVAYLGSSEELITGTRAGLLITTEGNVGFPVQGTFPAIDTAGDGGILDVELDPSYTTSHIVYFSYAEPGIGGTGVAIMRGRLDLAGDSYRLTNTTVVWRQETRSTAARNYGGRLAFASDGTLYVGLGDRDQPNAAQTLSTTLGKIIRIGSDGTIPNGNPFATTAGARPEIWTTGHRNPTGLTFDRSGRLYEVETGPEGGDEFNLVVRGANYGWPLVSEGSVGGVPYPRHATRPDVAAPLYVWATGIGLSGLIQYAGSTFLGWDGDFIVGGTSVANLIQLRVQSDGASEVQRVRLTAPIIDLSRDQGTRIWVIETGTPSQLRRLQPTG